MLGVSKCCLGIFCLGASSRHIWMVFAWGLGQILLGDRFFADIVWDCDFQDHICLGRPMSTTFFAWDLAPDEFAWRCEAGVSLKDFFISSNAVKLGTD